MSEIPADILATARSVADAEVNFGSYEVNTLAIARAILAERERCAKELAFADQQAAKVEALLEPHVQWEPGTVRICPIRDAICPHGLFCEYSDGFNCKSGWNRTP